MIPEGPRLFLRWLARKSPNREICGFIFKDWTVWPVLNVAPAESNSEFEMDHEETVMIYQTQYDEVMGVYHSHPGGSLYPSWDDVQHAPLGLRYFIVTADDVVEWRISDDKSTVERAEPRSPDLADPVPESPAEVRQGDRSSAGEGE